MFTIPDLKFPIQVPLRVIMILTELTYAIVCIQIALIFLMKYVRKKENVKDLQELGFFSFFLGYGLTQLFYIVADYYVSNVRMESFLIWNDLSMRMFYNTLGYFPAIIGSYGFIFFMEKNKKYIITKYFFTYINTILLIIYIIIYFLDINLAQPLSSSLYVIFILFFVIYMKDFIKKVPVQTLKLISGFIFLQIGYMWTSDIGMRIGMAIGWGYNTRLYGSICNNISALLIALFFLRLPPFSEFDWQEAVEEIFLINKVGICVFYQSTVSDGVDIMDQQSASAALTSLKIFLAETTKSDGISVIKQKEKIVVIYPGKIMTGVIISKKEYKNIELGLIKFINKIESIFPNILIKLTYSIDEEIFRPLSKIAYNIFYK